MKVEILKYPQKAEWEWARICTLNTVGLTPKTEATEEWKRKLLKSEHSPIRELWFGIKMEIPYWVSVHLVRHHIGVNHYVQSQRNDRQNKYDRNSAPQNVLVSHIMSINAQELIFLLHKRLCTQASKETRELAVLIAKAILEVCPEFIEVFEPQCYYRGGRCTEFNCCGCNKNYVEGKTYFGGKRIDATTESN